MTHKIIAIASLAFLLIEPASKFNLVLVFIFSDSLSIMAIESFSLNLIEISTFEFFQEIIDSL